MTIPRPCPHCPFCEFNPVCEQRWRSEDSLIHVADIRQLEIAALMDAGIPTLAQLAQAQDRVDVLRPERLARLVDQAALPAQARQRPAEQPTFLMISPGEEPVWDRGLVHLPQPDDRNVFLDSSEQTPHRRAWRTPGGRTRGRLSSSNETDRFRKPARGSPYGRRPIRHLPTSTASSAAKAADHYASPYNRREITKQPNHSSY
jgi:hypothetical protein